MFPSIVRCVVVVISRLGSLGACDRMNNLYLQWRITLGPNESFAFTQGYKHEMPPRVELLEISS